MGMVMVVDDNPDFLKVMSLLLKRAGHTGLTAASGEEARNKLREQVPDLMLLDLMMPQESGLSVLRKVRSDPRTEKVPVVIYSAVSDKRHVREALADGADDYWVKGTVMNLGDRLKPFLPDMLTGWAEPPRMALPA